MMKITGLSHLFKWENLHNWWLTKYFFAPLYISDPVCMCVFCTQVFVKEGTLMKVSRKCRQPRHLFLVNVTSCLEGG